MRTSIFARGLRFGAVASLLCFSLSQPAKAQESAHGKCVPAPSGLIGWWRGEGDARDEISKEAAAQDTVSYVAGKVGRAFAFSNLGTLVRIAASEKRLGETQNGFTLELWVNPRDTESGQPIVEFRSETQNGVHLWIYDDVGRIWGNVVDTANENHGIASGAGVLRPGVWQHLALVYDRAGTSSIYLNGAVVARKDIGSFSPQTGYDFLFGAHIPTGSEFFRGLLDEVSLYNRPLASDEIAAIYRAGSAGKCAPGQTPAAASTRASGNSGAPPKTAKKTGAVSTRASSSPRWSGRCLSVPSGDAMMVRRGKENVRVQLFGVAAPHFAHQSFGAEARLWTERQAKNKIVTVYPVGKSGEGRQTAWVFVGTKSLNAELLRAGLAWWDSRRAPRETKLKNLMNQARAAKRGLWKVREPIAPWAFVAEEPASPREAALQKNWGRFPLVKPARQSNGTSAFSILTLNQNPVVSAGSRYDGFRFKAEVSGTQDFVWAFVPPPNVERWYVAPRRADMKAFRRFNYYPRGDFQDSESLQPLDSPRVFVQYLSGDSLTPGAEYLVWFKFKNDRPAAFSFAFNFADVDSGNVGGNGETLDHDQLYERSMAALDLKRK